MMLERFKKYIEEQGLFDPMQHRVLLAVSGGMDSVVMASLFAEAGYDFGVAHCNFGLRGEESDADEKFVAKLARQYKAPYYTEVLDAKGLAAQEGISVQMAARELRYRWFKEIMEQEGFEWLATAHHQDDVLETVLFNLTKGTGIAGVHGIQPKVNEVIRPLLFAGREDIFDWLTQKQLKWREDSSNSSDRYVRNQLRNQVVPVLQEINPNIAQSMQTTVARIRGVEQVLEDVVETVRQEVLTHKTEADYIDLEKLKQHRHYEVLLYELLKPYGFSYTEVQNLIHSLEGQSGKTFYAPAWWLVKDRDQLVLTPRSIQPFKSLEIGAQDSEVDAGEFVLKLKQVDRKQFKIDKRPEVACLDYDSVTFPLKLRKWKEGDWFCPLGMNKKKKISDFLVDQKVPANLKEQVYVLTSKESVVWVVGYRIDNRFKIGKNTQKVFLIEKR